mmetsp:Transcript_8843/g.23428  ORF Transcript_8843/g.23428 Transcript_8843/m.23428 type:complete len:247 (+) Transcript_8843:2243-2983(+)
MSSAARSFCSICERWRSTAMASCIRSSSSSLRLRIWLASSVSSSPSASVSFSTSACWLPTAAATMSACFFIFSGSPRILVSCAASCVFCASASLFALRSWAPRSAASLRSLDSFCSVALCRPRSWRASSTAASSSSIRGWSSAICRFCVVATSLSRSARTFCRSCTSCCSSISRSSRIASSLSPLETSARSDEIASESSCARAAVFSSFPRSALRSWLRCFAFCSRFFSFSYVFSTTSCSFAYLLL